MTGNALLHTIKFYLGQDEANSQTTALEREKIALFAQGAKRAVEIGVYEGVNSVNILDAIHEEGVLYAIDPFFRGKLGLSYSRMIAHSNINRNTTIDRVVFIRKLSHLAVDDVPDKVDFIFIDGDHSLAGIRKDWEDWSKKVALGGYIALHDTAVPAHDPSVSKLGSYQYFQEVIRHDKRFELICTADSMNVLKKIDEGSLSLH